MTKTIAIMQPYIFPYIGYMNLASAADTFVFYDDVNFIKNGWINRNRIILSAGVYTFTVPLKGQSSNKLIKDVEIVNLKKFSDKFLGQLKSAYKNAPHQKETLRYVENVLRREHETIGELASASIEAFFKYVGVEKQFINSSLAFSDSKDLGRSERLVEITKRLGSVHYVNAMGGTSLYDKEHFKKAGINLEFVRPQLIPYPQANNERFDAGLSVIDLMMNQSIDQIHEHLKSYELI